MEMQEKQTWYDAFDQIRPYVVEIQTKSGRGTGFCYVRMRGPNRDYVCIATAAHVIDSTLRWHDPIKLTFELPEGGRHQSPILQQGPDWVPVVDHPSDAAIIVLKNTSDMPLPDQELDRIDSTTYKKVGFELAWVGYPSVHDRQLCLFSGRVSAYDQSRGAYLLDGTSIPGVSGGPVFELGWEGGLPKLIGFVTGYTSPSAGTVSTPGLCLAVDLYKCKNIEEWLRERLREEDAEAEKASR